MYLCRPEIMDLFRWPLLALINLACVLVCSSFLACALTRFRWRGRGMGWVVLAIALCAQSWIAARLIDTLAFGWASGVHDFAFADWLITAVSIPLLWLTVAAAPRDLEDMARVDGCGAFGVYWHIVLPLAKPALVAIGILGVLATWPALSDPLVRLGGEELALLSFGRSVSQAQQANFAASKDILSMIGGSLLMTLPLLAIFLCVRRYLVGHENISVAR
ncbi:MAG: hypothetical protein ABR589_05620 [Chthoniobacterales bacterium]